MATERFCVLLGIVQGLEGPISIDADGDRPLVSHGFKGSLLDIEGRGSWKHIVPPGQMKSRRLEPYGPHSTKFGATSGNQISVPEVPGDSPISYIRFYRKILGSTCNLGILLDLRRLTLNFVNDAIARNNHRKGIC